MNLRCFQNNLRSSDKYLLSKQIVIVSKYSFVNNINQNFYYESYDRQGEPNANSKERECKVKQR